MKTLSTYMHTPLIAILRGVTENEAVDVASVLVEEGFTMIEVPLNSPNACASIQRISEVFGDKALIGAGTVLSEADVEAVANAAGELVVSPNINPRVVAKTKARGMVSLPGVATPSELFTAIDAGADGAKVFPADTFTPATMKSWRSVIPPDYTLFAVGGITPDNMAGFASAGINGFGIGSNLYKPGKSLDAIRTDARQFLDTFSDIMQ